VPGQFGSNSVAILNTFAPRESGNLDFHIFIHILRPIFTMLCGATDGQIGWAYGS
jgi:hypothetical protein